MYLKKLLISLYKLLSIVLLTIITNCSHIINYPDNITNLFFIDSINESYGMELRHNLQQIFSNTQQNTFYRVHVTIDLTQHLTLTNRTGFASIGEINMRYYIVIYDNNNKVIFNNQDNITETYDINKNGIIAETNKQYAIKYLIDTITTNLLTQINIFIKQNYESISKQAR